MNERLKIIKTTSYYRPIKIPLGFFNSVYFCHFYIQKTNCNVVSDKKVVNMFELIRSSLNHKNRYCNIDVIFFEKDKKYQILLTDLSFKDNETYKIEDKESIINILEYLTHFNIKYCFESKKIITNLKLSLF